MRKILYFSHNEKGIILPSVLFLTAFLLLNFSTNLIAYQHDLKMTNSLIEQVNAQTLFQMGYVTYKNNYLSNTKVEDSFIYPFPNGKVVVQPTFMEEYIQLRLDIQTHNDYMGTMQKIIKIPMKD